MAEDQTAVEFGRPVFTVSPGLYRHPGNYVAVLAAITHTQATSIRYPNVSPYHSLSVQTRFCSR